MASKSKNEPPTSVIPGDDARRWREGVSAQRDAEIARRIASSIMSLRFVMPITRMLFSESTPSILLSNWLTILSETPVPSLTEPRDLPARRRSRRGPNGLELEKQTTHVIVRWP